MLVAVSVWSFPQSAHSNIKTNAQLDFSQHIRLVERADDRRGLLRPAPDIQPENNQPIQKTPVKETVKKPVAPKTKLKAVAPSANGDIQTAMKEKVIAKWGEEYWSAMLYILNHESGGDPYAVNPKSGACGIPQAYPCSKLLKVIGSLDNVNGQLDWMINYVANRYGDPVKAQAFHTINNYY